MLTFATVAFRVRWIPPAGSLLGKSKPSIFTPPFRLFMPLRVTFLPGSDTPGIEIPEKPNFGASTPAWSCTASLARTFIGFAVHCNVRIFLRSLVASINSLRVTHPLPDPAPEILIGC